MNFGPQRLLLAKRSPSVVHVIRIPNRANIQGIILARDSTYSLKRRDLKCTAVEEALMTGS